MERLIKMFDLTEGSLVQLTFKFTLTKSLHIYIYIHLYLHEKFRVSTEILYNCVIQLFRNSSSNTSYVLKLIRQITTIKRVKDANSKVFTTLLHLYTKRYTYQSPDNISIKRYSPFRKVPAFCSTKEANSFRRYMTYMIYVCFCLYQCGTVVKIVLVWRMYVIICIEWLFPFFLFFFFFPTERFCPNKSLRKFLMS